MKKLTAKEILFINYMLAKSQKKPQGVREVNLLKAALLRPDSSYKGRELYPDLYTKCAALVDFIVKGRPFKSANTATALAAGLLTLKKNGLQPQADSKELIEVGEMLESKRMNIDNLALWLKSLLKKTSDPAD